MIKIVFGAVLWALLGGGAAVAQSNPGLTYGQVPTAGQWNSYFSAKQDVLGYTAVNKAGDVLTGKLTTAAPTTAGAGLGLPAGIAPTSPVDGDVWSTSGGFFVRYGGTTYQLQTSGVVLSCSQLPALTGDITNTACATTTLKVHGVSFGASPSTDTVPVITASNTATYTAVPNCTSGYLQYSTSTHLFSCTAAVSGTVTSVATTAGTGLASSGTCSSSTSTSCTVTITASRPTGCAILTTSATTCADGSAGANNGTYPTPAGATWLEVQLIGGGGGGQGSGTTPGSGGNGGNTTFGALTGGGGFGATVSSIGASGGTASGGYLNKTGSAGQRGAGFATTYGGNGGIGLPGDVGWGGAAGAAAGTPAAANTGGGGGGGGVNTTISGGSGGGAGGFVRAIIQNPAATYSYAIGSGGTGGAAGTSGAAGGAGGSGVIIVIPHFGA